MKTTIANVAERRVTFAARLGDYVELTKPRIAALELATVAISAYLAGLKPWLLLHALIGTALVAASAGALNQWMERRIDGRMPRTAGRPLPAGRLSIREVVAFGVVTGAVGTFYLAVTVNLPTAALGLFSWALYLAVYTPLKPRTSANTLVGAISGAVPVLMGWTAMGQPLSMQAAVLFLIVFLWQFPHFMAIAWLYREQYRRAGLKMLTVVDPTGLRAGAQAALAALALLPVSLIPVLTPMAGNVYIYFAGAMLLGVWQVACAFWFFATLSDTSARRLLRTTLVYLPGLLILMTLAAPVSTVP